MRLHTLSAMVIAPLFLIVGGVILFTPADWLRRPLLPEGMLDDSPIDTGVESEEMPTIAVIDPEELAVVQPASVPLEPAVSVAEPEPVVEPEVPAEFRWVTAGALNLRTGPSARDELIASLPFGTKVKVLEESGTWVRIDTATGQTGWLSANFLDTSDPAVVQ